MIMKKFLPLIVSLLLTNAVLAAPITFDFKDPKGVNNAVFKLDAILESINGTATGISGLVQFDPEAPGAFTGKIIIAANSLNVPNSMMKDHLLSEKWIDAAKYPEISFVMEKSSNVKTSGNDTTANVTGTITIKGVKKTITAPVKISYLKDKLKARLPQLDGDLLVIRANFKVKRSDFNINPGQFEEKVSDEIDISLSIAGQAPKAK